MIIMRFCLCLSMLCGTLVLLPSDNGIQPYIPYYEPAVRRIALADLDRLTSMINARSSKKECERQYQNEIRGALTKRKACIYLHEGQCVGFITYTMYTPLIGQIYGSNPITSIHHMAVDERYRKRAIGTGLLQAVISESRREGAAKIKLTTNRFDVEDYYSRFGFRITKMASRGYGSQVAEHTLRLQPSTMMRILHGIKTLLRYR